MSTDSSTITNETDLAARDPLKAPENALTIDTASISAAREPIRQPEGSAVLASSTAAIPSVSTAVPGTNLVILPETFQKAEKNLATYLGQKLNPLLTSDKGVLLTLSNVLSEHPTDKTGTDLKLCLTGPMIEANFAEMSREVIQALQEHPQISPLLQGAPLLQIEQANSTDKGQMLHLHLPNLTPEKYSQLIQSLATGSVANQATSHDESAAAGSPADPQKPAPANQTPINTPQPDAHIGTDSPTEITAPPIKEPVIKEPVIKEAPIKEPRIGSEIATDSISTDSPTTITQPKVEATPIEPPKVETRPEEPPKQEPVNSVNVPVKSMGTQKDPAQLGRTGS